MPDTKEQSTLELIHKAAKAEFMEKGFLAASLRNIVKTAGVTTRAFYGYYGSKEALFEAIVGETAEYVLHMVCGTIDDLEKLPGEAQTEQAGKHFWALNLAEKNNSSYMVFDMP
ncbi:MAG: helix-turn-helix transcriptional regulator [Lachnospiraceae bacterium]|nr:helix-turn-helix transcriptional regulator [Lachnospiraceae bacterium]